MKPDKSMKLADIMYGHAGKFTCHLSGRYDPAKYPKAPPIQICQMHCGCWIVADGNNRVGLILRKNPDATLADISDHFITFSRYAEWDHETMDWINPSPRSFRDAMKKQPLKQSVDKNAVHGLIERNADGNFFACVIGTKYSQQLSAYGKSPDKVKDLLADKLASSLNRPDVNVVLTSLTPLFEHQCSSRI